MRRFWWILLVLAPVLALSPGDPVDLPRVRDSYGKPIDLAATARAGKYLLFWFYPKASSPGCTAQGKRYAELYGEFEKLGVEIFGVSADPAADQCAFIEQMALKGAMLPDQDGRLARLFKVGGLFGFYNRDTILVNPQGRVERIWRNVNAFRDADVVLAYVRQLKR
ncbi:peroxiredoxin [Meiothermus ruber]|jgi:peroxiredoxin Q/BCP|uniref:thioredoxin-dependent peroxiredoxin n=1 Tax=Meiothermus ruber (strain ATCC 35948 / DSM 1279 / VKM B-1258 / 21) TaxID=504728 RepID=D3PR40_MEIRD|nr:peroxiredoxin [Meiothermus ruber]ADD27923.1 alkyl hydroperoxide reductase/ Thiol specific antioxidant/ Mal allergen [Meiothermus ruber DSM 1279]AGK04392.1 alkyl hydroperoxide reductase [Meiothermus ruber DSM 1279]MCL6531225.1 peroxiredoxin [Meiothermus ruber]GAO74861.1 alkyl hydroperoxide reductase [Meiothermus ruber H328]